MIYNDKKIFFISNETNVKDAQGQPARTSIQYFLFTHTETLIINCFYHFKLTQIRSNVYWIGTSTSR